MSNHIYRNKYKNKSSRDKYDKTEHRSYKKEYYVPKYMNYKNGLNNKVDNPYLLFHRYLESKDKVKNDKKENADNFDKLKCFNHINIIAATMNSVNTVNNLNKDISKNIKSMKVYKVQTFRVKQISNIVIGLGQISVSETSMTLHHIYGIPYIPGQALKGITRNYIINEYFEGDEVKAVKDRDFTDIFGKEGKSLEEGSVGKIKFFDSYPVDNINCRMDIMNNHHSKYYSKEGKLNDTESPKPIRFMAICDTSFDINIAVKKKENKVLEGNLATEFKNKNMLEVTVECLKMALEYYGIGAKTAVGYGYFK